MVFPVVIYECESWTIKKAESWRINAFEPWCWRRLLRVPWMARRSEQSMQKEISHEYSSEGLMLKLKFQYFGYLMWRTDSLEKAWCWEMLKAGRKGDDRGWDGWMASLTQWTWVWVSSGSWWWIGRPGMLQYMESQRDRYDWATELNWWEQMPWSLFFECLVLISFFTLLFPFHQESSLSSLTLYFFFAICYKGGVICISEVIDISPGNLDSSLCFIQPAFHMMCCM